MNWPTKQSIYLPQCLCFSFKHIEITHHYRVGWNLTMRQLQIHGWHVINYLILLHNNMIQTHHHTANFSTESRLDWVRWVNLTDWFFIQFSGYMLGFDSWGLSWTESPPTLSARFDHGYVKASSPMLFSISFFQLRHEFKKTWNFDCLCSWSRSSIDNETSRRNSPFVRTFVNLHPCLRRARAVAAESRHDGLPWGFSLCNCCHGWCHWRLWAENISTSDKIVCHNHGVRNTLQSGIMIHNCSCLVISTKRSRTQDQHKEKWKTNLAGTSPKAWLEQIICLPDA